MASGPARVRHARVRRYRGRGGRLGCRGPSGNGVNAVVILETARLLFRHHETCDMDAYCEMMADPEFRRLSGGPPLNRAAAEKSFAHVLRWRGDMGLFAAVFKPEGRYIGRCGLYPLEDAEGRTVPGEAHLGHYIARPYWRRGLATEAGRAFIAWGFGTMGLSRVEAGVAEDNPASIRVVEKLGFTVVRCGRSGEKSWRDYELRRESIDRRSRAE